MRGWLVATVMQELKKFSWMKTNAITFTRVLAMSIRTSKYGDRRSHSQRALPSQAGHHLRAPQGAHNPSHTAIYTGIPMKYERITETETSYPRTAHIDSPTPRNHRTSQDKALASTNSLFNSSPHSSGPPGIRGLFRQPPCLFR